MRGVCAIEWTPPPAPQRLARRHRLLLCAGAGFVDGCFWHGCPEHATWPASNADFWRRKIETNQRRDRDTDAQLHEAGWQVLKGWEHEDRESAGHSHRDPRPYRAIPCRFLKLVRFQT
jgi:G:T-mismatch repair DNA endonuclease (very short patch repair protein)